MLTRLVQRSPRTNLDRLGGPTYIIRVGVISPMRRISSRLEIVIDEGIELKLS